MSSRIERRRFLQMTGGVVAGAAVLPGDRTGLLSFRPAPQAAAHDGAGPSKWFIKASDLVNLDKAGFANPLRAKVLAHSIVGCGPGTTNPMPGSSGFPDTGGAALCAIFGSIESGNTGGAPGLEDYLPNLPGPFSYVMYDCESWAITAAAEKPDPFTYAARGVADIASMTGPDGERLRFIAAPAMDLLRYLPGYVTGAGDVANYVTNCAVASKLCAEGIDVLHVQCQEYAHDPATLTSFFNTVVGQVAHAGHGQEAWSGLGTYKAGQGYITLPDQVRQDCSGAPAPRYWINVPTVDHQAAQHAIQFWEMQYGWAPVTRLVQVQSAYTTTSVTTLTATLPQAATAGNTLLVAVTNDSGVITGVLMNGNAYTFNTDYKPAGNVTAHLSYAGVPAGVSTVEVTISTSRANWGFTIFEVAGLASSGTAAVVDRANYASLPAQTSWNVDPYDGGTPATPNEFVVGIVHNSSGTGVLSVTSDWVKQGVDGNTSHNVTAYRDTPTGLASADSLGPEFQGTVSTAGNVFVSTVAYQGSPQRRQ